MGAPPLSYYEFFAGGGMARLGLGEGWDCLFANDFDPVKAAAYRANYGDAHFSSADVWTLGPSDLPGRADLAWASSPCQDFSLAGSRSGLDGPRSSAVVGFLRLVEKLAGEGRAPATLVIENVTGLISARGGADFALLAQALVDLGYRFGALEIDAAGFLPQSRPRVFVVACRQEPPPGLTSAVPAGPFHTRGLAEALKTLPPELRRRWVWWRLPAPPARNVALEDVLESDAPWDSPADTARLASLMNPLHRAKLATGAVGAAYRRVRVEEGVRVQRAEVRVDGVAGCLRTPAGGSSRQFLVREIDGQLRSRLVTPREGARLMGLPDHYVLPAAATAAWRVVGDGVAVPVVRWLAERLLEPLLGRDAGVTAAA
jgi:DNA (cytosine-5)-methyltransferase 1